MDASEVLDLCAAACVANSDVLLANRLDTSIDSVRSDAATTRRVVGLQAATANTGYFVGRLDGKPIITLDMGLANGLDQVIPLDIPIPVGQELSIHAHSTSGTAIATVAVHIARE